MKSFKILLIIVMCFSFSFICSCSKKEQTVSAETMEHSVAYELSKIDNEKLLNDETLKALSVVIRTKLYNKNNENFNDINSQNKEKNLSDDYSNDIVDNTNINRFNIDNKYLDIANSTKKQVLKDGEELADVDYQLKDEENWSVEIKKSQILKYMMKNNISLSNVAEIEQVKNNSGELESLSIGGRNIEFLELKKNFNLKSNKINSIEQSNNSILVKGETNYNKNNFDYSKINSENHQNYKEILKNRYNNYTLITI